MIHISRHISLLNIVLLTLLLMACQTRHVANHVNDTETDIPCSNFGDEFGAEYFIATAYGVSSQENNARRIALFNANNEMSDLVSTTLENTFNAMEEQTEITRRQLPLTKHEHYLKQQQILSIVQACSRVICDKTIEAPESLHKTYIATAVALDCFFDRFYKMHKPVQDIQGITFFSYDDSFDKFKQVFREEREKMMIR